MYVVWKQRTLVFWKPCGNTQVTTLVGYVGMKYKDSRRGFKHQLCVVSTLRVL